jgi:hypothetical protein
MAQRSSVPMETKSGGALAGGIVRMDRQSCAPTVLRFGITLVNFTVPMALRSSVLMAGECGIFAVSFIKTTV